MSERNIRAAVIGCGTVSSSHIESYQHAEGVDLVCLCDTNEERARAMALRYGVPRIETDHRRVFNDPAIDCLSLCTDHASHAPLTIEAIRAGKHILCEKPIASTLEGMERVFAILDDHPDIVYSGVFQHRFDASIRYLKKIVDNGHFGRMLTASVHVRCTRGAHYYTERDWRGTWEHEGGSVTINQALHSIDSLLWIMGRVDSICGTYTNHMLRDVIETEDTAVACLRFASGAFGTIETTASSNISWENTLMLHGSEGSLELREGKGIKVHFRDEELTKKISHDLENCYDPDLISAGKRYYGKTHPAQIADFVMAIREKRKPFVCPHSARHTAEVVLSLYRSSDEGRWITLPAPSPAATAAATATRALHG